MRGISVSPATEPRHTSLMRWLWIQIAQLLKQLLMNFGCPCDDHPVFVVTDVNEIVIFGRKQICIPSKDKTQGSRNAFGSRISSLRNECLGAALIGLTKC